MRKWISQALGRKVSAKCGGIQQRRSHHDESVSNANHTVGRAPDKHPIYYLANQSSDTINTGGRNEAECGEPQSSPRVHAGELLYPAAVQYPAGFCWPDVADGMSSSSTIDTSSSSLIGRRAKRKPAGGALQPRPLGPFPAASRRRSSAGGGSIGNVSCDRGEILHSGAGDPASAAPYMNLRTLEFAVCNMLPPDLTSVVEEDEHMLIQYRRLQLHVGLAMCTGCCDMESVYNVRMALVRGSTRRPSHGSAIALGNRSGAIDREALAKAIEKAKDMVGAWVSKCGKDEDERYRKLADLYTSWGLAAYYTSDQDIMPCLLKDMERHLHTDIAFSPTATSQKLGRPKSATPITPTRFTAAGDKCPQAPATAACFSSAGSRPCVVLVPKQGKPDLARAHDA